MSFQAPFHSVTLPDGGSLAFEVLGAHHLGKKHPIVLICGMAGVRHDWSSLSAVLAESRPVLVYDHRGIGDSSFSVDDQISIESMARDLLVLLTYLRWPEISLCGYSMGGVVLQQLLVLPCHPTNPVRLPFRVSHVFLTATRSIVLRPEHAGVQYSESDRPTTLAGIIASANRMLASAFDPQWLQENGPRFEALFLRLRVQGGAGTRSSVTLAKQKQALLTFDFKDLLRYLPRDLKVLVIHGDRDRLIPNVYAKDMMKRIPSARFVQCGREPGKIPSYQFGHMWYEYFHVGVWRDVLEEFMKR
ncbi:Alpha/Beta hydrolase protein [Mycena floridula]|nr:Alpha/Beta hydrolase protein [Mycena floridula]